MASGILHGISRHGSRSRNRARALRISTTPTFLATQNPKSLKPSVKIPHKMLRQCSLKLVSRQTGQNEFLLEHTFTKSKFASVRNNSDRKLETILYGSPYAPLHVQRWKDLYMYSMHELACIAHPDPYLSHLRGILTACNARKSKLPNSTPTSSTFNPSEASASSSPISCASLCRAFQGKHQRRLGFEVGDFGGVGLRFLELRLWGLSVSGQTNMNLFGQGFFGYRAR